MKPHDHRIISVKFTQCVLYRREILFLDSLIDRRASFNQNGPIVEDLQMVARPPADKIADDPRRDPAEPGIRLGIGSTAELIALLKDGDQCLLLRIISALICNATTMDRLDDVAHNRH
jgi:hypothetical protein